MHVIVASTNPVKINAAKEAFRSVFPNEEVIVHGESAPSGVTDQPMTEAETRTGAHNRVHVLQEKGLQADYYIGIEGGIDKKDGHFHTIAVIYIENAVGQRGEALAASFELPEEICRLVESGLELGQATDQVFNGHNSKQKGGIVGELTNHIIDRTDYYIHPCILALIPFVKPELYFV